MSPGLRFAEWLDTHSLGTALHESLYMYPLTESTHVWALALFVGFAVMLDLRLLGLIFPNMPVDDFNRKIMPWMVTGFIIMIITGFMLFYAIPIRSYQSVWFRVKVILLLMAGLNVFLFHRGIWTSVAEWADAARPPKRARMAAVASLILWTAIIFAGRNIAYNWFDCDRQPQPAFINWAAGCTEEQTTIVPVEIAPIPSYVEPPSYPDSPQAERAAEEEAAAEGEGAGENDTDDENPNQEPPE